MNIPSKFVCEFFLCFMRFWLLNHRFLFFLLSGPGGFNPLPPVSDPTTKTNKNVCVSSLRARLSSSSYFFSGARLSKVKSLQGCIPKSSSTSILPWNLRIGGSFKKIIKYSLRIREETQKNNCSLRANHLGRVRTLDLNFSGSYFFHPFSPFLDCLKNFNSIFALWFDH